VDGLEVRTGVPAPRAAPPAPHRDPRSPSTPSPVATVRACAYAWAVFTVALAAGAAVAIAGSPFPGPVAVLVLAVPLALSLNQYVFFPSEWSATAEAAVLVAGVTAFAGGWGAHATALEPAAYLGPWLVAFGCGPLDTLHWRQRAYWRMAYNAGNRMIAALLAALVFDTVRVRADGGWESFACGALCASIVIAAVDLVLFAGFERVRGKRIRAAVAEDLSYDALTVPLGMFGALAGWIIVAVGAWAGALALLPASFAPELVLVRARRAYTGSRWAERMRRAAPTLAVGAAVLAGLALVAPLPSAAWCTALIAVAIVCGLEFRADARNPVSPMIATVVVAAVVVGGDADIAAAVVAAVAATVTALLAAGITRWWAPFAATVAALGAAAVFDGHRSTAGAIAAALAFELIVLATPARIGWTVAATGTAVTLAWLWHAVGPLGGAVFVCGFAVAVAAAALVGSLPWTSGVIAAWSAHANPVRGRAVSAALAVFALAGAVLAAAFEPARPVLAPLAAASACAVACVASNAVRQWRFAPVPRVRDAAAVILCALSVVVAYLPGALDGDAWAVPVLAASVVVCLTVGWRLTALAEAAHARPGVRVREP
jgi:hypothetical protein